MYEQHCGFEILVNDRTIHEYWHQGKCFVEGRHGKEYAIRFRNNSSQRKKIVVSVDGLNVMTGDSTWERGYVVPAWGMIVIPGWRQDSSKAAAFEFASLKDSYNQHNKAGDAGNIGVIGCKVFNEVVQQSQGSYWPFKEVHHHHHYEHYYDHYPNTYWLRSLQGGNPPPVWNTLNNSSGEVKSVSSPSMVSFNAVIGGAVGQNQMNVTDTVAMACAGVPSPEPLGTGWGEYKKFETVGVTFEAEAHPLTVFLVYYDSRDGLTRRGINLGVYTYNAPAPNAFPGDGCPKPL